VKNHPPQTTENYRGSFMRQFWASIALIGFFLSFMIHIATYVGFNAGEVFPLIWLLHIVALVLWFVMVPELRGQRNWNKVLEPLPIWGRKLLGICFIYTAINFAVFFIGEVGKGVP
jgi:Mn2+/Fe2+ NRAMP family transporter